MKKIRERKLKSLSTFGLVILLAAFTFTSCQSDSESMPSAKTAPVTLQLKAGSSVSSRTNSFAARNAVEAKEGTLLVKGTNGTLKITSVYFIVDEFELEMADTDDNSCEGLEGQAEDDCENKKDAREEFELNMAFVKLPIGEGAIALNTTDIKDGFYDELEFEIDNLDTDEDDTKEEITAQKAVMQAIKDAGYTNWPQDASMVVEGVFAPTNGEEIAFKAYAEAEISVEMTLNPPLDTTKGTAKSVTVDINPEKWFTNPDGTVVDLSLYDETKLYQLEWELGDDDGFESDVD